MMFPRVSFQANKTNTPFFTLLLTTLLAGCGGVELPTDGAFSTTEYVSKDGTTVKVSNEPCPVLELPVTAKASFKVTDNLNHSYAYDLLPAIQLSSSDTSLSASTKTEVLAAISKMTELTNSFIHYEPEAPGGDVSQTSTNKSVANELDLMESLIEVGEIININDARNAFRTIIDKNQICKYDNSQIQVTNTDNEDQLRYYNVRFNYSPAVKDTEGNYSKLLTKTLASSIKTITPNAESSTQQFTAISIVKLNPDTFSASGYNTPLLVRSTFGDSATSITLTDNREQKTGRIEYITSTAFQLNTAKTATKRVRFDIDYALSQVKLYTSDFIVQYKKPDGTLVTDPTTEEFEALKQEVGKDEKGNYRFTQVYDLNYDTQNDNTPTPAYSYTGTSRPLRQ